MRNFKTDPERENEALWGDKAGYMGWLRKQNKELNKD
jgi:hypothetical protein